MSERPAVKFGVFLPQITGSFQQMREKALLAEVLGFDSFWLFDHLYAPGLPHLPALEGWTTATALLAQTARIRVGHLVLCNNFRHPALVARMASTLDVISGGRLDLGLGSGSYEREHHEAGLAWGSGRERSERLGEALEIVTRMFAEPSVSFEGRHYQVADLPSLPAPVQQPRPPIHVGGAGPRFTLPLVARYADVWNVPTYALGDWEARTRALDAACEAVGRNPAEIRRSHQAVLGIGADDGEVAEVRARLARHYDPISFGMDEAYVGTPAFLVERIASRVERGITEFAFLVPMRDAELTLRRFAAEVLPHFRP